MYWLVFAVGAIVGLIGGHIADRWDLLYVCPRCSWQGGKSRGQMLTPEDVARVVKAVQQDALDSRDDVQDHENHVYKSGVHTGAEMVLRRLCVEDDR